MIEIRYDDAEVLGYLGDVISRLDDAQPLMDAIGQRLVERVSMRFETESDPLGVEWAPWAPATLDGYPKDGNRRVLDRYSDMLRSLNHQAGTTSVRVGFGEAYAVYHEFGTKTMPRRGLLTTVPEDGTLAPDDREAILDVVAEYLTE